MARWGGCGLAFKEGGLAFGGGYGFVSVRESDSWAEVCGSEVGEVVRLKQNSNSGGNSLVQRVGVGGSVVGWWLVATRSATLSKKEKKS